MLNCLSQLIYIHVCVRLKLIYSQKSGIRYLLKEKDYIYIKGHVASFYWCWCVILTKSVKSFDWIWLRRLYYYLGLPCGPVNYFLHYRKRCGLILHTHTLHIYIYIYIYIMQGSCLRVCALEVQFFWVSTGVTSR